MGEALWDILPDGKSFGGAPANFAYHVKQFGLPGCVVSAVGNDALGAEIIENIAAKGLDSEIAIVPYPTGTVDVTLDAQGIPQYEIHTDVAWDNIPFTPALRTLASQTKAVCFGSLAQRSPVSRRTIADFIDSMPQEPDTLIVFDANLRQEFFSEEVISQSLSRCNVLKINDEELPVLARMFDCDNADIPASATALLDRFNLRILILTCGTRGSYVFTSDGEVSFRPTPTVEVADTVGAGDSFTAVFIASLLKGRTIADAHTAAVNTSAYVCTRPGATPLLPPSIFG